MKIKINKACLNMRNNGHNKSSTVFKLRISGTHTREQ